MPTPLDNAMRSKTALLAFGGVVTAVAAWAISGADMFPREADPTGNPEDWTREELRRWLSARGLLPSETATREQLLDRVKHNMRDPGYSLSKE